MNFLKRFARIVFGITGLLCLLALALPWFGPWVELTQSFIRIAWYRYLVLACVAVTAFGHVLSLLRGIFMPKERKTVTVSRSGGDEVTVTTAAIASQAAHIVEQDHLYFADKVTVRVNRRGKANVAIRVHPAYAIDVATDGTRLHDDLVDGLARLCGNAIASISLEFVEADSAEQAPAYVPEASSASTYPIAHPVEVPSASYELAEPEQPASLPQTSEPEPESEPEMPATFDITVPMGRSDRDIELTPTSEEV